MTNIYRTSCMKHVEKQPLVIHFSQEAEEKLVEINSARNESMDALKSHREEFGLLRSKIHESISKIKEYEELKKQKEAEYKKFSSSMNQDKVKLENELAQLKR